MKHTDAMAEELTARFLELPGVTGLFPRRQTAGGVLTLVADDEHVGRSLVGVERHGPRIRISARLASTRAVPSRFVVEQAIAMVRDVLGAQSYALDLELSYIE